MPIETGYSVASPYDITALAATGRADGMTLQVKTPVGIVGAAFPTGTTHPAWYTFKADSSLAADGIRVLMPDDLPATGRWHLVGMEPIAVVTNAIDLTSYALPSTGSFPRIAFLQTPQDSKNTSALYRYDGFSTLPALSDVVLTCTDGGRWIKIAPLTIVSTSLPASYNSGTPPMNGLTWIARRSTPARTAVFVSDNNAWLPQQITVLGTAAPSFTPDFTGQQFLRTDTSELYIASGTASSASWRKHSTGV